MSDFDLPLLLPAPRYLVPTARYLTLADDLLIALDGSHAQELYNTAVRLREALTVHAGVTWQIAAGSHLPLDNVGVTLNITPGAVRHIQGYELTITGQAIHLVAQTPAAIFYGVTTLVQLLQQYGRHLPQLRILDWPDYPNRGVMLDISRDKVPTMETLTSLVDLLASWKINQLQLYTEHTFAYRRHPAVWATASPMTGAEILTLDAYCRERYIELVPNQNSFGHLHRWLKHDAYRPLAECPDGFDAGWGHVADPFSLCPIDPRSLDLVRDMLDELLPHFSSSQVNVGCDETMDLGHGRSREVVAERGTARVYLDFLLQIQREVRSRQHTMQFWGDIIVDYPDLVAELPRDMLALAWGYEADYPFDEKGDVFGRSGIPFYVCPGTSTWNSIGGRTQNALGNQRNAAANGLKHGATGYLNTDWGDRGHWQPLPVSYLALGYGAALSWFNEGNAGLDLTASVSRFAFADTAGVMGQLAHDLGDIDQETDIRLHNGTILFYLLQTRPAALDTLRSDLLSGSLDNADAFRRMRARIDTVMAPLDKAMMQRPDAALVREEFAWTADMLRHACDRALWLLDGAPTPNEALYKEAQALIDRFTAVWLARNRSGGFADSAARMEALRDDYR
jgi:hypothetical protein